MADKPASPPTKEQLEQQQILSLLRAPVPRIYCNGYAIASSASDTSVVLLFNGLPTGIVSMSYISAKSLVKELQQAVDDFEKATGQEVKTMAEITQDLQKAKGPGNVL